MNLNSQNDFTRNSDSFFCRMSELAEGDTQQLLPTYRIAQEAYIVDQRLATLALGTLDGVRVLELSRGEGELPTDSERIKLGVFTFVSTEVARSYDLETARTFMRLADRYTGEVPVDLIGSLDDDNMRESILSLYDSTIDF